MLFVCCGTGCRRVRRWAHLSSSTPLCTRNNFTLCTLIIPPVVVSQKKKKHRRSGERLATACLPTTSVPLNRMKTLMHTRGSLGMSQGIDCVQLQRPVRAGPAWSNTVSEDQQHIVISSRGTLISVDCGSDRGIPRSSDHRDRRSDTRCSFTRHLGAHGVPCVEVSACSEVSDSEAS